MDSEHEDEVLTFREVFLGSRALELLLAGFIAEPPASDEEHALLASLLGASLGGDAALHQVAGDKRQCLFIQPIPGRWSSQGVGNAMGLRAVGGDGSVFPVSSRGACQMDAAP